MAQRLSQNLSITDNKDSFNHNYFININIRIPEVRALAESRDEDNEIREWLSPLKPHQRHKDVQADRLDGVGNWLLGTGQFQKWRNREAGCLEQVLFCSGGPGVGKTYLR